GRGRGQHLRCGPRALRVRLGGPPRRGSVAAVSRAGDARLRIRGRVRPAFHPSQGGLKAMSQVVEHIPTIRERALYSPQVLRALDPSPQIPEGVRFALVTAELGAKPYAFATLAQLARRIQRDRRGDPIQMTPVRFRFREGLRGAVRVTAEDAGG